MVTSMANAHIYFNQLFSSFDPTFSLTYIRFVLHRKLSLAQLVEGADVPSHCLANLDAYFLLNIKSPSSLLVGLVCFFFFSLFHNQLSSFFETNTVILPS